MFALGSDPVEMHFTGKFALGCNRNAEVHDCLMIQMRIMQSSCVKLASFCESGEIFKASGVKHLN